MKNDWIEQAWPIAAARVTAPDPKALYQTDSFPWFEVVNTQIKKITQMMMLMMP